MSNPHFIKPQELEQLLRNPSGKASLRLVDASWYLPAQNRDAKAEFSAARIGNAVFFDIDAVSDPATGLPHMLPTAAQFAAVMGALGISDTDNIVIYDGPGVFSSARAWWTFRIMGAKSVRILEGGMDGWKAAGLPVETAAPTPPAPAHFNANPDLARVSDLAAMLENARTAKAIVIDARPSERFTGEVAEPRPGLQSGHMPGARSLPFARLFANGVMLPKNQLLEVFAELGIDGTRPVITTCGSGVTAAILTLGLESAGLHDNQLYDGSWSEWGSERAIAAGARIEKGQ